MKVKKTDLGFDFLYQLEDMISKIEDNPFLFVTIFTTYRKSRIKRFPYFIFYALDEKNKLIEVVGIFHEKRSSEYIKKRLKS